MKGDGIRDSIRALDWARCHEAILRRRERRGWSDDRCARHVLEQLVRSGVCVSQRRDSSREERRRRFLDGLTSWLSVAASNLLPRLRSHMEGSEEVTRCFGAVLGSLDESSFAAVSADRQAWSLVDRFSARAQLIRKGVRNALEAPDPLRRDALSRRIEDGHGNQYRPDSVVETEARLLTAALKMLAYRHGWVRDGGAVVFPRRTGTVREERELAGAAMMLGQVWAVVEHSESYWRHLGGDIVVEADSPSEPGHGAAGVRSVCFESNLGVELADRIAHHRLERLQASVYLGALEAVANRSVPRYEPGDRCSPPPDGYLGLDEHLALTVLSHLLHFRVLDDKRRYAGLYLWQWCRGYSFLKCLDESLPQGGEPTALSKKRLVQDLMRVGIAAVEAEVFLEAATFSLSSRDSLDAPLLRDVDESLWLLRGPTISGSVALIVLSALSSRGASIHRKGKALERAVRRIVHDGTGLPCRQVKFKHDGEEFEIDAACIWDDVLLVFECKNHSLSGIRPAGMRDYLEEQEDAAAQLHRLLRGIAARPQAVSDRLGGKGWSKVIPCVLNGMPWSRPVRGDGIHTYDASALARFFRSPVIEYPKPVRVAGRVAEVEQVAWRLWGGERPGVADLVKELRDPIQSHVYVPLFSPESIEIEASRDLRVRANTFFLRELRERQS